MRITRTRHMICLMALLAAMPVADAQRKNSDRNGDTAHYLDGISLNAFKFRSIGPALTSGRISDLAVNPSNHSEFYVAAAAGGVWKTTNGGVTFRAVFDDQGSFSIGCIEMDPANHNVVWVGTGENNNQRSVSYGDGVYKSIDGGETWENVGLENSEHIGMITIDPRDPDVVYIAAYGPVWSAGGDRGVYKTTDGGKNWERVLFISENTGVNEVHMDPRDPAVLYATAHQRRRRQWTYVGGGPESGIFKSTDAGKTWEKINKGLPSGDRGRIGMVISPANPEKIYAVVEAQRGQSGFFLSTNRGASWGKMSSTVTSGNYYQELIADPVDEDRVYLMNTFTLVTVDGGKTFTERGEESKHWDNHCMWIDPDDPLHVIEGSDGGIYESFDRGKTWRFFTNLPVTQFYKVGVDNAYPFYNVIGGTQDNYSLVGPSQTLSDHGILSSDWIVTVTGDGFESVVDPEDPNIVYSQAQYGHLVRFDRKSGEGVGIQPMAPEGAKEYNWNWDSPLLISPHDPKTLYFASNRLLKSTDHGDSWTEISGELDRDINRNLWPVMGKVWPMDAVEKNGSTSRYGSCVSLDESRIQEGLIYAGTDDGRINITEDGGATWRKVDKFPGVPDHTYVYDIIADKHDAGRVYACFNNHKAGDFKPYVLKSADRGRTWTSIASGLPKGSVYALEQDHADPDILFAGTEYGVFVTLDGGGHWKRLGAGIPTANVRDMAIQERENDLVVATFGRGFYILDNYAPLREISEGAMKEPGRLFTVKDALMYNTWRPLGGLGSREHGFQGEDHFSAPNPERGAVFTYWVRDEAKTLKSEREDREKGALEKGSPSPYPTVEEYKAEQDEPLSYLVFTITDQDGNFIRELRTAHKKGIGRLTWDMKYPAGLSVNEDDAGFDRGLPSSDVFVLPGSYTIGLAQSVRGEFTPLAGPVDFELKELHNRTIPAGNRAAMTAFKLKTLRLDNALDAVLDVMDDMEERIPAYKAATKAFRAAQAGALLAEVLQLEDRLEALDIKINGDPVYRRLDLDADVAMGDRVASSRFDIWDATSNVTGTAEMNYRLAADEFGPILEEARTLMKDFQSMDSKLGEMRAPLTPGRLPDWKKE